MSNQSEQKGCFIPVRNIIHLMYNLSSSSFPRLFHPVEVPFDMYSSLVVTGSLCYLHLWFVLTSVTKQDTIQDCYAGRLNFFVNFVVLGGERNAPKRRPNNEKRNARRWKRKSARPRTSGRSLTKKPRNSKRKKTKTKRNSETRKELK